jgi:hypothetical protein
VVVGAGTLPAPILKLPNILPVNAHVSASGPPGHVVTAYNWSITQQTSPAGGPAAPTGVLARAASASFSTASGMADLGPHDLTPGRYLISVTATDSSNAVSPSAQADVTLVPAELSAVRLYPNPWRADWNSGAPITFINLALSSTVKIFTVSGHLVKTLPIADTTATWDLTTDSGDRAGSGIYLYLVTTPDGQKTRGQFAIVR